MRLLVLTALAVALAATPAPADPTYHYTGGCDIDVTHDNAGTHQTNFTGSVTISASATHSSGVFAPVAISVDCLLYVDGIYKETILSAAGIGHTVHRADAFIVAHQDADLSLCNSVYVDVESHFDCVPFTATPVPARGSITVADSGSGPAITAGYDSGWACALATAGSPPTSATGTCTPGPGAWWGCPAMTVSTTTAVTGAAGGRATCDGTSSVDTGVVSGTDTASLHGAAGNVVAIECTAYAGPSGVLVAPYSVTCTES